jgi:cadmium resistance protein CadD (predicted permease)
LPTQRQVAAVTAANGADSVGIYTPLFASSMEWRIAVTLLVFYAMVGAWLLCGWALVRMPLVAKGITTYGDYFMPALLMGLGVYIMLSNNTQTLVGLPSVSID